MVKSVIVSVVVLRDSPWSPTVFALTQSCAFQFVVDGSVQAVGEITVQLLC